MRKITLIAFVALILAGCQTSTFFTTETYLFDFRTYAEKGFYMSTAGINQQYMPLGEITVDCQNGYNPETLKMKETPDGRAYGVIKKNSEKINCTPEFVLELLYNEAKALGANGVIHIEITGIDGANKMIITGLLVKIKK